MAGAKKAARRELRVSDHALFRWLQHAHIVDVEQIRTMLSTALDRAFQAGAAMGGREFIILAEGMVFVVRDDVVTTVIDEDSRHTRARALAKRAEKP
jgi:hypothetical protein